MEAQILKDIMIRDIDFIEKYMIETILHAREIQKLLNEKRIGDDIIESNMSRNESIYSRNESSIVETACKSVKENNPNSETVLSKEDLKGTRIEHGFKRAFLSLFGQNDETFTSIIQFQQFIDSQFTLDYDSQMTNKYFVEYTGIEYDKRVIKRQMQTQEKKVDTDKALDANLVVKESSGTKSGKKNTRRRSRNDTDVDDADIRPVYDEEPMAEVQLTVECNVFATEQQHTKQPEFNDERRVDQYTIQCQVKSPLLDPLTENQTTELPN
ncbi:hypothetical protein Tco_0725358 [Tanacetum coccineum]|uniref:Uncharacterized protein n=1 Tax=Tanacetum coccineum TaxID=301880 RepID=A0ABQ4YF46_9ASTR